MALSGICFLPWSSNPNPQSIAQTQNNPIHCPIAHHHRRRRMAGPRKGRILSQSSISKRSLNLSIVALILSSSLPVPAADAVARAKAEDELQRYIDAKQGFTLLLPSTYVKVDKAGATVLFEEVNKGANNVGVVVSPVRLTSLREFGTPQFVVDKLIQAEKRKESTRDVELITAAERPGKGEFPVYEFEYKLDSTRGGMKRIFSAAFVSSKKLYLLNIAHADKPESPLDSHTRSVLERVLHSFDAVPST
ncbi:PsbP domain-containing protein 2, chloroplastic [Dionaea muscipula]